jgi:hypothetical protein
MIQGGQHPGLALESRQPLGVFRQAIREHLDGYLAAELGVGCAIHHAHAAGAELLLNSVVTEGLADQKKPPFVRLGFPREPTRELQ